MTSSASAASKIQALRKILAMEKANGYQDVAVSGGLDLFLRNLERLTTQHAALRTLADRGLLAAGYAALDPPLRERWAEEVEGMLASMSGEEPAKRRAAAKPAAPEPIVLASPVGALRGVTRLVGERLAKLGLRTVVDLLYLFPNRHADYSVRRNVADLQVGEEQTTVVRLWEANEVKLGRGGRLKATEAVVGDESGNLRVVWFGNPWLAKTLRNAAAQNGGAPVRLVLSGKVTAFQGRRQMESPEWEILDDDSAELVHTGRLVPVYPSTEGLAQRTIRRVVREALDAALGAPPIATSGGAASGAPASARPLPDTLPAETLARLGLPPLREALWQMHYPASMDAFEEARRRFAFDELLLLQLAVASKRRAPAVTTPGVVVKPDPRVLDTFVASLPFELTAGQRAALDESLADMASVAKPMSRLLQGDVGSGKTVVALALLLAVASCGHQGALMAPTEVLAEQHFLNVRRLLAGLGEPIVNEGWFAVYVNPHPAPINVGLLTGSTRAPVRRELIRMAADGALDILLGTHALIQDEVDLPSLALAVVDEQHRFGVMQRSALRGKGGRGEGEPGSAEPQLGLGAGEMGGQGEGETRRQGAEGRQDADDLALPISPSPQPPSPTPEPHLLVMSATPIPRTLALTLYGDLDVSTMPELPAGRQPITTRVVPPSKRPGAEAFLVKQANEGRQSFVVCPLIDESEAVEARAATEEYERLRTTSLAGVRVALLHGRMSLAEKQSVMDAFRAHEIDVLVTTPVVEVGIDVPNATVMLIEGADRFGLAQLHQLRGRVGRGAHQSYCFLLTDSGSEEVRNRLAILVGSNDGFEIAEADLRLRGPGDFFGTRQAGLPTLRVARLSDRDLLATAREEARRLLERDPSLADHPALAGAVRQYASRVGDEVA